MSMFKKFVYWFADVLDVFWVTVFGFSKQSRDLNFFQHIPRERYPEDPDYPVVRCKWGKRKIFAVIPTHGRPYDVKCLLVNNKFVIIDHRDGNKRKYAVLEDRDE